MFKILKKLYKRFVSIEEIPKVEIIRKFEFLELHNRNNKSFHDIFRIGIDRSPSQIAKNKQSQKLLKNIDNIKALLRSYDDLKIDQR